MAEEASTDGTMNEQCLYENQNCRKTTITKLPMDFLEVPEPSFTRGFLELAEEAKNVCVENEQCLHVDEVLPQVAVMAKPGIVTIAEYSHPSPNYGATVAPRFSTERPMPVAPAGRCFPVDQMGQAGPGDETDQSVFSGSESEYSGTDSVVPVGPYVTFDQVRPVADGPVGPLITLSPVGSEGIYSRCDCDQPVADGPVGPSVTLGPVGPGGMLSPRNSDQPVADGPVGPLITLSPVGSDGMYSLCDSDQPVADGPVGTPVTLGPVDPGGTLFQCNSEQPVADGPVGPSVKLAILGLREMSVQIDSNEVVMTNEPAELGRNISLK